MQLDVESKLGGEHVKLGREADIDARDPDVRLDWEGGDEARSVSDLVGEVMFDGGELNEPVEAKLAGTPGSGMEQAFGLGSWLVAEA